MEKINALFRIESSLLHLCHSVTSLSCTTIDEDESSFLNQLLNSKTSNVTEIDFILISLFLKEVRVFASYLA